MMTSLHFRAVFLAVICTVISFLAVSVEGAKYTGTPNLDDQQLTRLLDELTPAQNRINPPKREAHYYPENRNKVPNQWRQLRQPAQNGWRQPVQNSFRQPAYNGWGKPAQNDLSYGQYGAQKGQGQKKHHRKNGIRFNG